MFQMWSLYSMLCRLSGNSSEGGALVAGVEIKPYEKII